MNKNFTYLFLLLLLGASAGVAAQNDGKLALDYLQKEYASFGLELADVSNLEITDNYTSPNGTRHIYVTQRLHGFRMLNAAASLHFRGDRLVHRTSDLAPNLASVLPPAPAFSAQIAARKAVDATTIGFGSPIATEVGAGGSATFAWPQVSPEPITVQQVWYVTDQGIRPAYQVLIDQHAARSDIWDVVVDATTGDILAQNNRVLKCTFAAPAPHQHTHSNSCTEHVEADLPVSEQLLNKAFVAPPAVMTEESSYHVFPFGEESPLHGERVVETNPAHPVASPFGWHDTNGEEGAEFTITRGNNTYAYPDRDGDNRPDTDVIADGGDSLQFDFFYAENQAPDTLLPAALAQTFYYVNKLHDWLYVAGFDEAAGNFQRRNYTGDGQDGDEVLMEVQDNAFTANEPDLGIITRNNANFAPAPDGFNGRIQMFLWDRNRLPMAVTAPASIAGEFVAGLADFGPEVSQTPVIGQVAISQPTLACDSVTNDLTGKIALITRGDCNFSLKVFNAQEAGAIGVVICNDAREGEDRGGLVTMTDGNEELEKTIPAVFLTFESCVELRNRVVAGDSVSVTLQVPPEIDGDFDNGIVAHELGHGVSTRLVGGPSNVGCLNSSEVEEQMGEGWSDFFTIAASPQTNLTTPDGTERRGIGNFATRSTIDGGGIRPFPYSTDLSVNPQTYDDLITVAPVGQHSTGAVWNAMLWDLYWALTDEIGMDPDLIDGTGGNNYAVQLVLEGMKLTKCRPGMVDGRQGILAADRILSGGTHQCLIWEVFARRGLGFSADQGSSLSRTDGQEAFDMPPSCSGIVFLTKTVDQDAVNAGEGVTYTLKATNYREGTVENVVITDMIPEGMTLDPNSIRGSDDFTIDGQTITFNLGAMEVEDEETILYSVATDPNLPSREFYFDNTENGDNDWDVLSLGTDPTVPDFFWEQTDTTPYAGNLAWYVVNVAAPQDQVLQTADALPVLGDNPALRFFTKYDTEARWDAGIVEVSTNGTTWNRVDDQFLRGEYRGEVSPNGSAALIGSNSFWGNSNDYREIIIDLSDYADQDVFIRWRFISDQLEGGRGWWVDNIQIMDVVSYDSPAVLTSDAGDNNEASVGNLGVIAEAGTVSDTYDPDLGQTKVSVFPNPADAFITVNISTERSGDASVQLLSIDGRVLHNSSINLAAGGGQQRINTASLPAGMYVVRVTGADQISTTKVTIN